MTIRKNTVSTNEESATFTLQLPAQFDIKPVAEVAISKNYTARIFKTTYKEETVRDGKRAYEDQSCYIVRTANNKTGAQHSRFDSRGYGPTRYRTELEVKFALEELAACLAPKKKTTVVEEEND